MCNSSHTPPPFFKKGSVMASAEELYASPYLSAKDLGNGETHSEITEAGVELFGRQGEKRKPKITMRVAAFRKSIVLNKTNASALAKEFGDDYEKWPGHRVRIKAEHVEMQGMLVLGIQILPLPDLKP